MNVKFVGCSLYCYILAIELKKKRPELEIEIIEKSDTILSMWKSLKINEQLVNNGFHGIEMPRSEELYHFLSQYLPNNFLVNSLNKKLIYANGSISSFQEQSSNWPSEYVSKLPKLKQISKHGYKDSIINSKIWNDISLCSERYGDDPLELLDVFYPWFFPSEYKFEGLDEGYTFQNSVRSGLVSPWYYQPKTGLFSDLIIPLSSSLKNMGINISTNVSNSTEDFLSTKKSQISFWMSSMANLYSYIKGKSNLEVRNKRYLHNMIFFLQEDKFEFSEILVMAPECIGLSRISKLSETNKHKKSLVQLEYHSKENKVDSEEIRNITNLVRNICATEVSFGGSSLGRVVFSITPEVLKKAEQEVINFFNINKLDFNALIKRKYWYPINMNKCYIYAQEDLNLYLDEIDRKIS